MKNKTLKFKLAFMTTGTILIIGILSIVLSTVFSTRYYTSGKKKALVSAFNEISKMYIDEGDSESGYAGYSPDGEFTIPDISGGFTDYFPSLTGQEITDEVRESIDKISQNRNLAIIIYRDSGDDIFNYFSRGTSKILLYTSFANLSQSRTESNYIYVDYLNSKDSAVDEGDSESGNYEIMRVSVARLGASYLYLNGRFSNGDYIMIRSSVEGINESVDLSNRFYIYITLIASVIGFVVMYFLSGRFLRPIEQLTDMAKRMSKLDFSAMYEVQTEDEVGDLGNSINTLSTTLEKTLGELKSANVKLRADLEQKNEVDEMRKEFLSNVSHELKTPIAIIQGYAEGLIDNVNDDPESREYYCEVIVDESRKMNDMVRKLMNLNQLEFGYSSVDMEYFDIIDLIRGTLERSDILIKQNEADIVFDCEEPVYVWSDAFMAEEVFTNYLTNALNHLDGDRKVEISVEKGPENVRVSVFNSGSPIPDEDIEKIWDKFYKVDKARTREYGGSGVGLSIVKAAMTLLGRHYGVENAKGGVRFWFELDGRSEEEVNDSDN
ncbi:MAG: HAMP domain-containing histidine kinase [Lachnospiraceae bacterium]|nr:HAMP domain-containing histidine kinase [Lachnospiraceae bacterium]